MDATAHELISRLRRRPDDAEAFQGLRLHYQRLGDHASLVNLLEGWAARTPQDEPAAAALAEAAELVAHHLNDAYRAVALYERALERHPFHPQAFSQLGHLLSELGEHQRHADALGRRADYFESCGVDRRHVALLHQQLGEIWEQSLQRTDRAVSHFRKAYELDPSLVPAIYGAREIYRRAGNFRAAARLYEMETEAERALDRKVGLLRELGHLLAERLGDLDTAVATFERAVQLAPGEHAALHDLATALLRRADQTPPAPSAAADRQRAAGLLYQLAQHEASTPTAPEGSSTSYCEAVLDADPSHEGALLLLETLAIAQGRRELLVRRWERFLQTAPDSVAAPRMQLELGRFYADELRLEEALVHLEPLLRDGDRQAAEALVGVYRQLGRTSDLVVALGVTLRGEPAERRIVILRELVGLCRSLGDRQGAVRRSRELLDIEPFDVEATGFLEDEYRIGGDDLALRDLILASSRAPGLALEIRKQRLREVANLNETKLNNPGESIAAWRTIVSLDPVDADALAQLGRLFESTQRWDELVAIVERQAQLAHDNEARIVSYRRLATVQRQHLGNRRAAADALRRVFELAPQDRQARDALCDAYLEAGDAAAALPLLQRRVEDESSSTRRVRLLRTIAECFEGGLHDDENAVEACQRLLAEQPGDLDALERLERLDTRRGRYDRLVETLQLRLQVAAPQERGALFLRIARLFHHELGQHERAAESYWSAYDNDRESGGTLDEIVTLYEQLGRPLELLKLLQERAASSANVGAAAKVFRRIARLLQTLKRPEEAEVAWEHVLLGEEDEEALRALCGAASQRGDKATLSALLPRLAAVVTETRERRDLLVQQAELLTIALGRQSEAIAILETVAAEIEPEYLPALERLCDLYEWAGDAARLAQTLDRRLTQTEDPGLQAPLAERLYALRQEAGEAELAITALRAWVRADPSNPWPHQTLAGLLYKASRWREYVDCLDSIGASDTDAPATRSRQLQAADVLFRQLGDADGAWQRLLPLVETGDVEAENRLGELARSSGLQERLSAVYVELAKRGDSEAAKRRWHDASRVYEYDLGDLERAFEAMLRSLALDLGDADVLSEVNRLGSRLAAWPRLLQVYERLLRQESGVQRSVELLQSLAAMLDQKAGDCSGALDQILRALDLEPHQESLLIVAEDLAFRSGRAVELVPVYDRRRREALEAADEGDAMEMLLRLAQLYQRDLDDSDQAILMFAQAVDLAIPDPERMQRVENVATLLDAQHSSGALNSACQTLLDVYQRRLDRPIEVPANRYNLARRLSSILAGQQGDEPAALVALMGAYLDPSALSSPEEASFADYVAEFAAAYQLQDAFEHRLATAIEEALDADTAIRLLQHYAKFLRDQERFSEAADAYARLVNMRPDNGEFGGSLREMLQRSERHEDLLVALERQLRNTLDAAKRLPLLKETARLWEEHFGNPVEARVYWQQAADIDAFDNEIRAALSGASAHTQDVDLGEAEISDLEVSMTDLEDDALDAEPPEVLASAEFDLDALPANTGVLEIDDADPLDHETTVIEDGEDLEYAATRDVLNDLPRDSDGQRQEADAVDESAEALFEVDESGSHLDLTVAEEELEAIEALRQRR